MSVIRIVDLFAGTGGFSMAFEKTSDRFKTVFANDIEPSSKKFFDLNVKSTKLTLGDINELVESDIPDCDIITAGFPCQPFSLAGKKKGFEDSRSNVFWKLLKILEVKKPKAFLLENVKNLKTHNNGDTIKIVLKALEDIGYFVKYKVIDTSKISDIPQGRERIYIVGFLEPNKFIFPSNRIERCSDIEKFLETEDTIPEKYFYEHSKIYDKICEEITDDVLDNVVYQYRRHYVRKNKSGVVPTLTANMGTGGHNVPLIFRDGRIRKLTPRECFYFQGFQPDVKLPPVSDSQLYKLAGNGVSISVVEKIAKNILAEMN